MRVREDPFGGGLVDLLVLSAIGSGESYGYAIAQHLVDHGVDGLREASVYASLRRLEDKGLLDSRQALADNGKARRYYSLTRAGDARRAQGKAAWEATHAAVLRVLAAAEGDRR
jgi:PadR family transcriptional regulator PadR